MNDMQNLTPVIDSILSPHSCALFCGAGISVNSGLPLAGQLAAALLARLPLTPEDTHAVIEAALPFEVLMNTVVGQFKSMDLFEIYREGAPSNVHSAVAKLARAGFVDSLFTTNFDTLLEKALVSERLVPQVDFSVLCDESHFVKETWIRRFLRLMSQHKGFPVIKIHGCVSDPGTIRATLADVAARRLAQMRKDALCRLVSAGRHHTVIVLGYSCSDYFDLVPFFESIEKPAKTIVFVEHTECSDIILEDIRYKKENNPFRKYPGLRLRMHTDVFIDKLLDRLQSTHPDIGLVPRSVRKPSWEMQLDRSFDRLGELPGARYILCGFVMRSISHYDRAICYFGKALEEVTRLSNAAESSQGLFSRQFIIRDFSREIARMRRFRYPEPSMRTSDAEYERLVSAKGLFAGFVELLQARYSISHQNAVSFFRSLHLSVIRLEAHEQIGDLHIQLGNYRAAVPFLEMALKLAEDLGLTQEAVSCGLALRTALDAQGKNRAGENVEKAGTAGRDASPAAGASSERKTFLSENGHADTPGGGEIDEILDSGNKAAEFEYYYENGKHMYLVGNFERATVFFRNALEAATAIKDTRRVAITNDALGSIYRETGHFRESMACHAMALAYAETNNDTIIAARCLCNIANACNAIEDFTRAVEHAAKSIHLARELGDKGLEVTALLSQANALYGLDQFTEASSCFDKSLEINQGVNDGLVKAKSLFGLASIALYKGEYINALRLFLESETTSRTIGTLWMEAKSNAGTGETLSAMGQYNDALVYLHKAEKIFRINGQMGELAEVYKGLERAYKGIGKTARARKYARLTGS